MKKIDVIQEGDEIPVEVMAQSIQIISEGIKKLRSSRLNDKALFLLISNACKGTYGYPKPSPKTISTVIDGIESLEKIYLKKV